MLGDVVVTWTDIGIDVCVYNVCIVEKLQFSKLNDLLSPGSQYFLDSCATFLKTTCLHVSFTAYENFYKLTKNVLSS